MKSSWRSNKIVALGLIPLLAGVLTLGSCKKVEEKAAPGQES